MIVAAAQKWLLNDPTKAEGIGLAVPDRFFAALGPYAGKTVTLRRQRGEAETNVIYAREVEPLIGQREEQEEEVRELLTKYGFDGENVPSSFRIKKKGSCEGSVKSKP